MKTLKGFFYDLFGGIVILLIVCGTFFCCSSSVRDFVGKIINPQNDSITIISKDSTSNDTIMNEDVSPHLGQTPLITKTTNKVDTIPIKKGSDNLYYVQVKIKDIPMRFAIDTGCSDMSMSVVEYLFLVRQGIISESNNKECVAIMANGEEEECFTAKIESITIGSRTIKDIRCTVSPKQDASLLIGQSVLSQLGDVTIKYNKDMMLIEN